MPKIHSYLTGANELIPWLGSFLKLFLSWYQWKSNSERFNAPSLNHHSQFGGLQEWWWDFSPVSEIWKPRDICWNCYIPLVYGVVCGQLAHLSLGNWKDIYVTHHIIIIIKSEVSTIPIVVIFFLLLCVGVGCTIIFCHLLHICTRGAGTWFPLLMCSLWCVQMIRYIIRPAGCVPLLVHYCISLSSLCSHIWRNCTSNRLVRYMLSSVCLRLSPFSQLSVIKYMGLCVFSLPNSLVMIVRTCTLSYHHQIGSMNH